MYYRMGSIPARAGEPQLPYSNDPLEGVYPRACGGTLIERPTCHPRSGLSPRVRGNLRFLSGTQGG